MDRLPNSLSIAIWVVGSCWAVAIVAYVFDGPRDLIFPLVAFGTLTGVAEWYLRRHPK
jgi:hypothetical protein